MTPEESEVNLSQQVGASVILVLRTCSDLHVHIAPQSCFETYSIKALYLLHHRVNASDPLPGS